MSALSRREALALMAVCTAALMVWIPILTYFLLRDALVIRFIVESHNVTAPIITVVASALIGNLKPYEEMSCLEVVMFWTRMKAKAPQGHSLFMSPNKALWAVVDEKKVETIGMWDVNTGHVYQSQFEPSLNTQKSDTGV